MSVSRLVGVTVLPEYLQSESVPAVLDRLQSAGVNALTTSPYVMRPADQTIGSREPPIDAGAGKVRLLDRPLWGQRELWVRTSPSFEPDKSLYQGLRYQPADPDELTQREGHVIDDVIRAGHDRGMKVYFQIMSAIPPGYRVQFGGPMDEDKPRMPDGRIPAPRVANNGSLASPEVIAYEHALIRDLCQRYPSVDGIRFDWPEYPPYSLDDIFVDFSEHVARFAARREIDFEAVRASADALYSKLHGGLTDKALSAIADGDAGAFMAERLQAWGPVMEGLVLKALLVDDLLAGFRLAMDEAGGRHMAMLPNAFPPPWNRLSGFDCGLAAKQSQGISVKLYGMHWAMMLQSYGRQLLSSNPSISEPLLVRALLVMLGIEDGDISASLENYRYPAPHEPHPGGEQAQARKIAQAQAAAGTCPVYALAHGYGPLDDFRRRLEVAVAASPHGVWLNRYGYLSDDKIRCIAECRAQDQALSQNS